MPIPFTQILALALLIATDTNDCRSEKNDRIDWYFVSCLWSAQECAYSCANPHIFKVIEDRELCPEEGMELACYCGQK